MVLTKLSILEGLKLTWETAYRARHIAAELTRTMNLRPFIS